MKHGARWAALAVGIAVVVFGVIFGSCPFGRDPGFPSENDFLMIPTISAVPVSTSPRAP